jgi:hypothetical protein
MGIFEGFDLVKGTKMKAGIQGAGALIAGWQAHRARIDYGNKMSEIKAYEASRQPVMNVFGGIENPYANLPVATQAAQIQMEQTDQALAATLDTIRETGASAGGATALAQAALQSKQGISASIEKQEADNAKLKAQGQLQVDVIKGKGEQERFKNQEVRDLQQLDRMQSQADILRAQELASNQAMIEGLGNVGSALISGLTAKDIENPNEEDKGSGNNTNNTSNTNTNNTNTTNNTNNANGTAVGGVTAGATNSAIPVVPTGPVVPSALNSVNQNATNLSQFYGQGGLPSVSDRSKVFSEAGLGSGYSGTAQQNTKLLDYLKGADDDILANLGLTF